MVVFELTDSDLMPASCIAVKGQSSLTGFVVYNTTMIAPTCIRYAHPEGCGYINHNKPGFPPEFTPAKAGAGMTQRKHGMTYFLCHSCEGRSPDKESMDSRLLGNDPDWKFYF
jgi:hypothetical protein